MARKQKQQPTTTIAEVVFVPTHPLPDTYEAEADPDVADDLAKRNSVVKHKYKVRYAERATAAGITKKAAKRSAWDWLAQTIAAICLDEKQHISIERFCGLLEANGIEKPMERWPNKSKGWEGRLRMTGRLALQRIVAEAEVLRTEDGEELVPPAEWVAHYRN